MTDDEFSADALAIFGEELFSRRGRRRPTEEVVPRFKRLYSISPLEISVRREENEDLKYKARALKRFLKENLGLVEYVFLKSLLGDNWQNHLRMPLEYRHFDNGDFEKYLADSFDDFKERIHVLMEACAEATSFNRMPAALRCINIPYNLTPARKIVEIYEQVQQGAKASYPSRFFHHENLRIPRILTRHLVDGVLCLPHTEELPDKLTRRDFAEHELAGMLAIYFTGDVRRALRHAYRSEEFPELYRTSSAPDDMLRTVFQELDLSGRTRQHTDRGRYEK